MRLGQSGPPSLDEPPSTPVVVPGPVVVPPSLPSVAVMPVVGSTVVLELEVVSFDVVVPVPVSPEPPPSFEQPSTPMEIKIRIEPAVRTDRAYTFADGPATASLRTHRSKRRRSDPRRS